MRVVVDANIVVAALLSPTGWTARQLQRPDVEFSAPEFLWTELEAHVPEFAERRHVARRSMRSRLQALRRQVQVVSDEACREHAEDPLVRDVEEIDPRDAQYAAALLACDADHVWTRDRPLVKGLPDVFVLNIPER